MSKRNLNLSVQGLKGLAAFVFFFLIPYCSIRMRPFPFCTPHRYIFFSFIILAVLGAILTILFPYAVIFFVGFLFRYFYERLNRPQFKIALYNYILLLIGLILLDVRNFHTTIPFLLIYAIQAVGASIVLLLAYNGQIHFFNNRIVVWLGNMSYEFYLLHFIILLVFRYVELNMFIYILICLVVTSVSAFILNRVIKRF